MSYLSTNKLNDVFLRFMRPNINTLLPVASEKLSGLIWKLKLNNDGLIAIESRNSELKQVSFTVLDFTNGKVNFKELSYNESWNLSLAFIANNNLIINGYEHPDSPESKGILSINVKDGATIWQQFNISLNQVRDEGLQVYDPRFQPRRYTWIDHLTAEKIEDPSGDLEVGKPVIFPGVDNSFEIPSFIDHGQILGEIYQLFYSDKIFLSFHEVKNDYLEQRIIVYQGDKVLIDDILISGIQKLQPEAFFIQQNHLFYIRNKQEIISYLV